MKKTLYLDLDGVLVDFHTGALSIHGKTLPRSEMRWSFYQQLGLEEKEFYALMGRDFWAGLQWTVEGPTLWLGLSRMFGEASIALVTSPVMTPGCVEGKRDWVTRYLGQNAAKALVVTSAKALLACPDKILVDDNDHNVATFAAAGGLAITAPRPWNKRRHETDQQGNFDPRALLDRVEKLLSGGPRIAATHPRLDD